MENLNEINLEFSKQNLKIILQDLIQEKSIYTHENFANWIYKFVLHFIDLFERKIEFDANLEEIVYDIDAQWELYLANSFSGQKLKKLDLSLVKFPVEWLKDWNDKL